VDRRTRTVTDEQGPVPGEDTYETEHERDTTPEPEAPDEPAEEPNPWLKEGADAPDAADIEDPDEQR
jgi:hypothetical protein